MRTLISVGVCRGFAIAAVFLSPVLWGSRSSLVAQSRSGRMGLPQDWTHRHTVFTRVGPVREMMEAQREPRSFLAWQSAGVAARRDQVEEDQPGDFEKDRSSRWSGHRRGRKHEMRIDWSINLGTGGVAAGMSPAKFSFDINTVPSCANDFVVFPVFQTPGATQENIVAFNNLYSGTAGGNGICNRTPSGSDDGVSATVFWSYAINAIGGSVVTSPVLSLDGNKVAFVESGGASAPHFHVLAWKSGDGANAGNLQSPASPSVITSFSTTAPATGSGAVTDLAFGTSGDTLSSTYIDYVNDTAYVGDDQGNLVRIKDVFCTVNPACSGGTPPVPSLDTSWGTTGSATVGSGSCAGTTSSALTGPVLDPITGNVFVGCADGNLYGFNSAGAPLATASIAVGDGPLAPFGGGGIVDPPIVDSINGFVYAFSGSDATGTSAVVVQAKTDLSSPLTATVGGNSAGVSLHVGAFNDPYFNSSVSTNWLLYVGGYDAGAGNSVLYGITFDASRNMATGTPANAFTLGAGAAEYSPLTEFLNGGTDWLFGSVLAATPNNTQSFNINTFPTVAANTANEAGGTSGIIVDNVSTQTQASSIYFSTQLSGACGAGGTGFCATKLTQAGLQ